MIVATSRRLQSVYVPMGDGVRLAVVDARGTGASFGTRTGELGEREIKDYGELIGWVAA